MNTAARVTPPAVEAGQSEPGYLQRARLPFAAAACALIGPFLNFLHYHRYPVFSAEVAPVLLGMLAIAAVIALLYPGQRRWGKILLEILLIVLAADLTTDSLWIPAIAALMALAFVLIRKSSLLPLITIMGVVVIVTGFVGLSQRRPWISTKKTGEALPTRQPLTLLHIILDEHPGIESLRWHSRATGKMEGELTEFYGQRGFRLYGRAYSENYETLNSIPRILNYGTNPTAKFNKDGGVLEINTYFDALRAQGFNVKVFQSSYLDFCTSSGVTNCTSYWHASLRPVYLSNLSHTDKRSIITWAFISQSNYFAKLASKYDRLIKAEFPELTKFKVNRFFNSQMSTLPTLRAFDLFILGLRDAKPGDAYFAHLLLPHDPFIVDRQCNLLPRADWRYRRRYEVDRRTFEGQENQLRCVEKKLTEALDAIGGSRVGSKNLVAIIHGDHGSRMVHTNPIAPLPLSYQSGDLVRAYSTLFAIKAPGITAGYVEQPAPVSWLLAEAARSRFSSAPDARRAPKGQRVFVADTDWKVRGTTTLPAYW